MIDWDQLKSLKDAVGDEDFSEVVELFLEETQEVVDRLTSPSDRETLEEDLHFLKGSALNLGFKDLTELCQTGETMSARGQSEAVQLEPLLTCYESSKTIFLREMPNL